MRNLANFHRLKNSNFILESKVAELNQNKNSKQADRPDAVWKIYFTLEKMKSIINKTSYTCPKESLFLRYKKISKKAVKLGGFLQCSVYIFLGHDGCFWKINLVKPYEELSSKAWSIWQHQIPQNIFFWKLWLIIRPLRCWH